MAIKRFLSQKNFDRLMEEREYLIKDIIDSEGQLQLCLRENYFNVYYRGNSLAKVWFSQGNKYTVEIHNKFVPEAIINDPEFTNDFTTNKTYHKFKIKQEKLRKLLQKKHIKMIKSKIEEVGYKEELEFQHGIMAGNILNNRECLIDIQITDKSANRKRMDLMALKNIGGDRYKIVICEVKLGNNKELSDKVYYQVKGYSNHVKEYFECYKETYENQYYQLKKLGLIPVHKSEEIVIDDEIEEMIIVGRYLDSAKKQIADLVKKYPDIQDSIRLFDYKLELDPDKL